MNYANQRALTAAVSTSTMGDGADTAHCGPSPPAICALSYARSQALAASANDTISAKTVAIGIALPRMAGT